MGTGVVLAHDELQLTLLHDVCRDVVSCSNAATSTDNLRKKHSAVGSNSSLRGISPMRSEAPRDTGRVEFL